MQAHPYAGSGPLFRVILQEAECAAPTDSKVLITGESGVGKEVLARYIHDRSLRSKSALVTINCAGIPETLLESELFGHIRGSFTGAHRDRKGRIEMADRGTLLLDEIGEMSVRMQTLLLRFLETGEVQRVGSDHGGRLLDVRLIAATNRDLHEDTRRKTFREDLYYRLNVVHLVVPPLRERRDEIAPLFDHYLTVAADTMRRPRCRVVPEALERLRAYRWPGNIRELRNVAERLALRFSDHDIRVDDLPREVLDSTTAEDALPHVCTHGNHAIELYGRMVESKETFWTAVYEPFMRHDVTRETVRALIRRGLEQARGNYRELTGLFNLPATDYKAFLGFLHAHDCNMPFKRYRPNQTQRWKPRKPLARVPAPEPSVVEEVGVFPEISGLTDEYLW